MQKVMERKLGSMNDYMRKGADPYKNLERLSIKFSGSE